MKSFKLPRYIIPFMLFTLSILLPTCSTVSSTPVSAASCGGVNTSIIDCKEGGSGTITHVLRLVLDILTIGIGIVGVVGISWVGIQYLTAGGNEEKTKKSKRRLFEVVLGIACYVILYGATTWLLPGDSTSDLGSDNDTTNGKTTTKLTISHSGKTTTEESFIPTVKFGDGTDNTTYSLASSNSEIVRTWGQSAVCVAEGKAKITAIAADGSKATMKVNCRETKYADDSTSSTSTNRSKAGSKTAPDGSTAASDGSATVGSQKNVKLKYKPQMRKETRQVIKDHNTDFFWYNYQKVLKNKYDGSYNKYIQSLTNKDGSDSVFSSYGKRITAKGKYKGRIKHINVKTAADFQAAAEYVWGLMALWGIDYSNGTSHHPYWGDPSDYHQALDKTAYHYQEPGREGQTRYWDHGSVNDMLKGPEILGTGCNMTINTFYKSTNLTRIGGSGSGLSSQSQKYYHKNGGVIDKASKLEVGDILQMPGGLTHVAVVGEVYKDYVIVYDGGSKFQYNRNYKFKIPRRNNNSLSGTDYSYYPYFRGYRVWDIDQSVTLKGLNAT